MPLPTEADWGNHDADLDRSHSYKTFVGRTNEDMLPHFRNNVIETTDELRWMPEVPFQYYVLGFRDFVMAGEFDQPDAADAANCFLRLILEKLENQPTYVLPIMPELLPAIRHVASNQTFFGANKSIYGSFREKLSLIESLYQTLIDEK